MRAELWLAGSSELPGYPVLLEPEIFHLYQAVAW